MTMKVMIVDDCGEMRGLVKDIVAPFVDESIECSDGDEAVAVYPRERPDWVIMDVRMERVGGLEATGMLMHRWPGCRVILISQLAESGLSSVARAAGAFEFLNKDQLLLLPRLLRPAKSRAVTEP